MFEKLSEKFGKAPSAADHEGKMEQAERAVLEMQEKHLEKKENSSVVKIKRSVCC